MIVVKGEARKVTYEGAVGGRMSKTTCVLFNLQRFSTEDGPGIRTTLFFKGCPLTCGWCHNPEGMRSRPEVVWQAPTCLGCGDCALACPQHAIRLTDGRVFIDQTLCKTCGTCAEECPTGSLERIGTLYRADDLLHEVLKDRAFYAASGGGVTFSGGEPLMQHAFLLDFAPRCREKGVHVALDTSGFAPPEQFQAVLDCVDMVLFDLKVIDPDAHRALTGVPLDVVLANLDRAGASGLPIWIRTPVIPGYTDAEENLKGIAAHIRTHVPNLERYDLLAFSNLCTSKYEMLGRQFFLAETPLLTRETMERLTECVSKEGVRVVRWSGTTREGQRTKDEVRNTMGEGAARD